MEFIVTMKRKFPSQVPCGLPPFTFLGCERDELTLNRIRRPLKKAKTIARASEEAPHSFKAEMQARWSKRLKALLKSIEEANRGLRGVQRSQNFVPALDQEMVGTTSLDSFKLILPDGKFTLQTV